MPFLCISILFIGIAWYGKRASSSLNIVDVGIIGLRLLFVVSGIVYPFHFSVLYLLPRPLAVWTHRPFWFQRPDHCGHMCISSSERAQTRQNLCFGWWFCAVHAAEYDQCLEAGEFYLTSDRYAYIGAIGLFLMLAAGFSSFIHPLRSLPNPFP